MKLQALQKMIVSFPATEKMPVLFLGHGSPMNALEENEFTEGFRRAGQSLPKPNAILCLSAHWETRGTFVTVMENPPTIHDFRGFPKALSEVQYPAPGHPALAKIIRQVIEKTEVGLDDQWGLDHGAWSVVKHLYPEADVPVVQMSLDYTQGPQYHYDLARELALFRERGVLIIGSGNMVHNLGLMDWCKMQMEDSGFDWALDAGHKMKKFLLDDNHQALINYRQQGASFLLSVPTPEHYLPLLYVVALKEKNDRISLFNEKTIAGSIGMTSVKIAN